MSAEPFISVVVPVYACASCLGQLCSRLKQALQPLTNRYEIILVDDRGPDNAWTEILTLQKDYPQVKGIRLSRNYGQHIAISAGLAQSRGDAVVVMDCDLQDPPEKIAQLYAKMQEGHDVVLAKRIRRNHSLFRVAMAKIYFRLLSKLTKEHVDGSYGAFSMLSRKVVNGFLQFNERERHYLFIIRWLGFSTGTIEYAHEERACGKSSYSVRALVKHALEGLFFQATVLLHWIVFTGLSFSLFGVLLAVYYVTIYFQGQVLTGWTSLVVLLLISTGMMLTSMGVIGLYIGKIFDQTKGRPLYVVDLIAEGSP